MDKPHALVQKIIYEEDKVYTIMVKIELKKMVVTYDTGITFTTEDTVEVPLRIKIKKNDTTMDALIEESIAFNEDRTWQHES